MTNNEFQDTQNLSADLSLLINDKETSDVLFLLNSLPTNLSLSSYTSNIPEEIETEHVIVDNPRPLYAHRAILSARSAVFRAMFYGAMRESVGVAAKAAGNLKQHQEIVIPNIDFDIFLVLLRYIYTGQVKFSPDTILATLAAANQYNLDGLKNACEKYITACIDFDNACYLLQSAKMFNADELFNTCKAYVESNAAPIFVSDAFQELREDILIELLQSDELIISELEIFNAVVNWGKHQLLLTQQKKSKNANIDIASVISKVITHIRLPIIPAPQLIKAVKPTKLVPSQYFYEAIEFHAAPTEVNTNYVRFRPRKHVGAWYFQTPDSNYLLSNGNLTSKKVSQFWGKAVLGSAPFSRGKIYWEVKIDHINADKTGMVIGVITADNQGINDLNSVCAIDMYGNIYGFHSVYDVRNNIPGTWIGQVGDSIGILLDMDNQRISFSKNGVPLYTALQMKLQFRSKKSSNGTADVQNISPPTSPPSSPVKGGTVSDKPKVEHFLWPAVFMYYDNDQITVDPHAQYKDWNMLNESYKNN